MAILVLDHVVKRFGDFTAVDDLSFEVPQGRIFGFLGRNGAGKTTTLRMVLDILRPTSGTITVLGQKPGREALSDLGFLPEERGLYRRMTPLATIVYFGRLKGMSTEAAKASAKSLLARFELDGSAGKTVDALSKGMAQKVQLACALVNSPKLVMLDEPFSGLDPISQALLEDVILDLAKGGATVVFSTHVMQHAERLCDQFVVISKGRKVFQGTPDAARDLLPSRLVLSAREDPRRLPMVSEAVAGPADADGWAEWAVTVKTGAKGQDVLEACFENGLKLRRFEEHRPSLHDIFIHLAGDEASEKAA